MLFNYSLTNFLVMGKEERYKKSVPDRRHAYSDYPSSVSILKRALKSPDLFVERIAGLLKRKKYSDKSKNVDYNARSRAKKILKDLKSGGDALNELEKEIVSEALDEGFFEDLGLDEAWHPHNFLSDNCGTTFPLQHDTCVLYTGQNKRIFFSNPGKWDIKKAKGYDEFTNTKSIFDQGYLAKSDTDKTWSINDAVFLTFDYKHAADDRYGGSSFEGLYESSVVFEVEVPSSWLTVCKAPNGDTDRFRSLQELIEEYDSPQDFRQRIIKGDNNFQEKIQFEIEKSGLPLEYITGVWDLEKNKNPSFYTLGSYHRIIYQDFPFRVPWNVENVSWNIEKEYARKIRMEKLRSKGVFKTEELIEEVENLSKEIIQILGVDGSKGIVDSFDGSLFRQVKLNGKMVPLGCNICGTIFRNEEYYCRNCGTEVQESQNKKFEPVKALKILGSELADLKLLTENPLNWSETVKNRWEEDDIEKDSAFLFPWNKSRELVRENYRFVKSLNNYIVNLADALNKEDKKENIKRLNVIKRDLERCGKDLDKMH